jgi:Na+/H+ antiporter NhaD/arsenite permease-like protein
VLVFLLSLFVVVGGVEAAGVLEVVSRGIFSLAAASPLVLALFLLWVGAGLGAVMSAIPTTVMLIPVVQGLGQLGVPLTPLWWSLALGIGLGANATTIGTAANLTTLAVAERSGTQIGARLWFSTGLPVAVLSCLIASMLLWLAWGWFS